MTSKKDYVAIAKIIKRVHTDLVNAELEEDELPGSGGVEDLAGELASYFASDNPNFDRGRFLTACGLNSQW